MFMKAKINESARGIGDSNKLYIIKHFRSMFRFFAREVKDFSNLESTFWQVA
jgi:hypothetical protein